MTSIVEKTIPAYSRSSHGTIVIIIIYIDDCLILTVMSISLQVSHKAFGKNCQLQQNHSNKFFINFHSNIFAGER